MTACMLWGCCCWSEQVLLGTLLAVPFVFPSLIGMQIRGMPLASFIMTVVMVPMTEEGLFRGVLAPSIAEQAGWVHGAFVSSLLFAIFHAYVYGLNAAKMLFAFAFGFLAAVVDFRYRSVVPGTVAHMIVNAVAWFRMFA